MTQASEDVATGVLRAGVSIGRVTSVRGSRARIGLPVPLPTGEARATVGNFLAVEVGSCRLVGMITEVTAATGAVPPGDCGMIATASVDLMGEIRADENGRLAFKRGVSIYPTIGDAAVPLSQRETRLIYEPAGGRPTRIGHLHNDPSTSVNIDVDSLVSRHFAILGSTGVGKSSGVAIILNEIRKIRTDLRIFLLDSHNEYGRCFGEHAVVLNPQVLKLPFWLFNFEEFVDVIYGGRPGVEEELEILAELVPIAKSNYTNYKTGAARVSLSRPDPKASGFTVDTPVPYLIQDLVGLIDERMGKLENRASRMHHHRLMHRIDGIRNDPRYDFMFENANVGGDTMAQILSQLFRIEAAGRPITVMQLAGLPVEVVDAVVCVLARLAFDFGSWSDGAVPLLFVCEEAHRYAAADHSVGFAPTRRALARIAKEGRKYRVFLSLVSQRPAELDPTVLSQCATLFAMRMANDRDQSVLRAAVSDAAADLLEFVPSLGTREVVGFGEGVPLPARMVFKALPEHLLPASETSVARAPDVPKPTDRDFVQMVVDRWRHATVGRKLRQDETASVACEEGASIAASVRLDQAKYQLLKR